jgi:hypothetical protein
MDTVYLTVGQIETLYRLSKTSQIGMELRSTVSDQSVAHVVSVLKDGSMGWSAVLPDGTGPNLSPRGKPQWER